MLHAAITGEKDKGATVCLFDKMRDPMLERFLVTGVARVGHFLNDEYFHLRAKIERTAQQYRLGFVCADALPKISEVGTPDCERGAGHDAGAIFAKNHPAQHRRDIDGRGVEREKLRSLSCALNPVNVFACALLQKNGDALTRVTDTPAKLLELCLQEFVIGAFDYLSDARL